MYDAFNPADNTYLGSVIFSAFNPCEFSVALLGCLSLPASKAEAVARGVTLPNGSTVELAAHEQHRGGNLVMLADFTIARR
jgi:hypothetical protein